MNGFNGKVVCKNSCSHHMGNPIQYRNTDNPSQIQGWVSHNKGGFHKTAFIVMVRPPGAYRGG